MLVTSLCANAGPKIEFDTKSFNCGTVAEGKTDKVSAIFMVKNTGDSLLKLESVRPGCGCTNVKYDTTVLPGKTGKIGADVNIKGYHSGSYSKYVTVTSNAKNDASVKLTIEIIVQASIDVSETAIALDKSHVTAPKIIYLSSKKTDMKVTDVSFKSTDTPTPPEKENQAVAIKTTWTPLDSTRTDGYKVYKLAVFAPVLDKQVVTGDFVIKTNHPDKAEISLHGVINK
jgi:hypothetical protein